MSHNFSFLFSYRGCFCYSHAHVKYQMIYFDDQPNTIFHSLFKISAITINFVMSYNFSFSFPTWGVLLQKSKWNYICIQLTHTCFSEWEDVFLHEKEISILYWESIRIDSSFSSRNTSFPLWKQEMSEWRSGAVLGRLLNLFVWINMVICYKSVLLTWHIHRDGRQVFLSISMLTTNHNRHSNFIPCSPLPKLSTKWYILTDNQMPISQSPFKICSITIHFSNVSQLFFFFS